MMSYAAALLICLALRRLAWLPAAPPARAWLLRAALDAPPGLVAAADQVLETLVIQEPVGLEPLAQAKLALRSVQGRKEFLPAEWEQLAETMAP